MTKREKLLAEVAAARPFKNSSSQDAVTVEVTFSVKNSDIALLKIGGRAVRRDEEGKASLKLPSGAHLMEWRAYGSPKQEYVISIEAPERVKWKPHPPLSSDSTGFVANQKTFTL
ncbi:MAG: hypothetical protein AAF730_19385 [Bacteroidota bacterium]